MYELNASHLTIEDLKVPPFRCANCSASIGDCRDGNIYCSDLCGQEAAYVRRARRCRTAGTDKDPTIKDGLKIVLGHILAGGYDKRGRTLSKGLRDLIKARDGGNCQICGKPGDEIDHISGSNDAPENLQLLCDACHNKKTLASFRPVNPGSPEWMKAAWLTTRANAEVPIQVCDREREWEKIEGDISRVRKSEAAGQFSLFG
jgi:hypothetical protein